MKWTIACRVMCLGVLVGDGEFPEGGGQKTVPAVVRGPRIDEFCR